MQPFTITQQTIINYIIAENEETEEPNMLSPYIRAIAGRVEPDMRFTLCNTKVAGLILYLDTHEESPEQFKTKAAVIKNRLLEIADFILYLIQEDYVRTMLKEQSQFPPDIPEQWQPYKEFTLAEQKALVFTGSMQVIPRLKLYEYWRKKTHNQLQVTIKVPETVL
jgi:hypothetical protein